MNRTSTISSILVALLIVIPFACGGGSGSGGHKGHKASSPDLLVIANYAAANVVIGQADFTTSLWGVVDAKTLGFNFGHPLLYNGVLYMPDCYNRRVLGFNQVPVVNGAAADFVIGQPDFTSSASSAAADGAWCPQTIKEHNGKLLITMYVLNSVYIYNTIPIANGASADVIVGQDDFGIANSGCAANRLDSPESIFTVGGKLIVADSWNNRVLIWNTIPVVNGASADIVLGQPNPDTCDVADPPTASSMNYPSDIWSNGKRLVVADSGNNRVLIWNTFPTSDGQPANVVLGQATMITNTPAVSDRDMDFPYFLDSNGRQLFVSDDGNNRVLIWDTIPTQNYTPADGVLGQPDFNCNNINENDGNCATTGEGPGPRGFYYPDGMMLTGDMLIIMDTYNHRALVFRE